MRSEKGRAAHARAALDGDKRRRNNSPGDVLFPAGNQFPLLLAKRLVVIIERGQVAQTNEFAPLESFDRFQFCLGFQSDRFDERAGNDDALLPFRLGWTAAN